MFCTSTVKSAPGRQCETDRVGTAGRGTRCAASVGESGARGRGIIFLHKNVRICDSSKTQQLQKYFRTINLPDDVHVVKGNVEQSEHVSNKGKRRQETNL